MVETIREFLLRGEKEECFLISDVANHGCSGGTISELIYYEDCNKFYDKHHEEIWNEVNELGGLEELITENGLDCPDSDNAFKCILTWLTVESIAQHITNERDIDKAS
tara:strand:+ start:176 stop:499 length:324 start_codon:yes stop_codon:yes gene_type:complete